MGVFAVVEFEALNEAGTATGRLYWDHLVDCGGARFFTLGAAAHRIMAKQTATAVYSLNHRGLGNV